MENINFIVLFALAVIASGALGYLLSMARKHSSKLSKIDDLESSFNFYQIQMERETEDRERGIHQRMDQADRSRDEIIRNLSDEISTQRNELSHDIGQLGDDISGMVERRFDTSYNKFNKLEDEVFRAIDSVQQQIPKKKGKLGKLQREY